jgi:hypothetical protein
MAPIGGTASICRRNADALARIHDAANRKQEMDWEQEEDGQQETARHESYGRISPAVDRYENGAEETTIYHHVHGTPDKTGCQG